MLVHHNNSMVCLAEWNFLNLLCFTFCYSYWLLHFHTCSIFEVIALLECIGVLQSYSIVMSLVDILNFLFFIISFDLVLTISVDVSFIYSHYHSQLDSPSARQPQVLELFFW
jgi:hypothetical protein